MARKDNRFKSKSDYTLLRNNHKLTSKGRIYENDLMTISKMDELFSDQKLIYSDGNFKFSIRTGSNGQRKHYRGGWVCPDNSIGNCVWTLENVGEQTKTTETRVRLNPNYNSISDFAYYGSAVEMLKASVNEVLLDFPAELYFGTDKTTIAGEEYYLISNPYGIDIDSPSVESESSNKLRYFCESFDKYNIITNNRVDKLSDCLAYPWLVERFDTTCLERVSDNGVLSAIITLNNGAVKIYSIILHGNKYYCYNDASLKGLRIRPNSEELEKFYNKIPDFLLVLLNRDSWPLYRATFTDYTETEEGIQESTSTFTWPASEGYNPDVEGASFENYLEDLMRLCAFHDEFNTDNLWQRMTHESIKNLDWTFTRQVEDMSVEYDSIDSTKISAMLRLYGRIYDDVKLYIDGIKHANDINYTSKSSALDYVLSDLLENRGFDANSLSITTDNTVKTQRLYPGTSAGYTASDANVEFTKRLALNSRYINSMKGTRHGIETMLSILGFGKDEYEINEYVVVASGKTYDNITDAAGADMVYYPLYDNMVDINATRDSIYYDEGEYPDRGALERLPLAKVSLSWGDGEEASYVIPWFDKNKEYDGTLYFQQYGGWGKTSKKPINLEVAPNITELKSNNLTGVYAETYPSIRFARDITEMTNILLGTLTEGVICYVSDISSMKDMYKFKDDEEQNMFDEGLLSNYFILDTLDLCGNAGYVYNDGVRDVYGWKAIPESEYNTTSDLLTEDGKKVVYNESIKDITYGNNPHCGKGKYDLGQDYVNAMTNPFKWAVENEDFGWYSDSEAIRFLDYGFVPVRYIDNRKCWVFTDESIANDLFVSRKHVFDYDFNDPAKVGADAEPNFMEDSTEWLGKTELIPFNPEKGGETYGEPAANSIINVKNLEIIFKPAKFKDETRRYVEEKVMPYLMHMIPSTAIFEYKFEGDVDDVVLLTPKINVQLKVMNKSKYVEEAVFEMVHDDDIMYEVLISSNPKQISRRVSCSADWIGIEHFFNGKGFTIRTLSDNNTGADREATITVEANTISEDNYNGIKSITKIFICRQKGTLE